MFLNLPMESFMYDESKGVAVSPIGANMAVANQLLQRQRQLQAQGHLGYMQPPHAQASSQFGSSLNIHPKP